MEELQDLLLCEIRRIAVLKSYDTDPYSSRIRTYPDVPCSKTCDVSTECQELYSFQFVLNPWHRKSDVRMSLKRGVWRPGNFLILSDLPQIMAYRIRARGQSNCVFLKIVFSTVRTVSLSILVPKFYGTRRIDLYSRTRFSTVIRESRSIQEPEIPRY